MAFLTLLAWVACALALGGLILELINLPEFPVLVPQRDRHDSVVACIAMRNAQADARSCVESLLEQPQVRAVIVCDDHSDDATAMILAKLAHENPCVRLVSQGSAHGKAAALATAARAAEAFSPHWLFFTDADICLERGALSALIAYADARGAQAASAWPRMLAPSLWDTYFTHAMLVFLLQALPMRLARTNADPRFCAANGQLFLIERDAYVRSGGHAATRDIVEDVALARALKRAGAHLALASGARIARTYGYGSLAANLSGYGRSLRHGAGRAGALVFGIWQLSAFLAPWLLMPFAPLPSAIGVSALVIAHAIVAQRLASALRFLPCAIAGGAVAGVAAVWIALGQAVFQWRGREVASR